MRRLHTAAVLVLVVAMGLAPVAVDRCVAACERSEATPAATPHCHHAASQGLRLAQVPSPCGHDHRIVAVARTTEPVRLVPRFFAYALPALAGTLFITADLRFATASRAGPRSPDTRSIPLTLSSPLRI